METMSVTSPVLDTDEDADKLTVLIVEDQPEIRSIFKDYLTPETAVEEAESVSSALKVMDEEVDMVVLDRNMAGSSGDEFLEKIRAEGYDVPVAMVTAIFPDFDIAGMEFDAYLLKPVGRMDLRNAVAAVVRRHQAGDPIRTYFATLSKVVALDDEYHASDLVEDDDFQDLQDDLEELEDDVRQAFDELDDAAIRPLVADFAHAESDRIPAFVPV